jgi:hypothetical protein
VFNSGRDSCNQPARENIAAALAMICLMMMRGKTHNRHGVFSPFEPPASPPCCGVKLGVRVGQKLILKIAVGFHLISESIGLTDNAVGCN